MGIFNFVKRVGNKVADGIHSVAKVGNKVLGKVHSIGNKINHYGTMATGIVNRIPVIGATLAPVTGVANAALGQIKNVADAAGVGQKLLSKGDKMVKTAQNIVNLIPDEQTNSSVQRTMPARTPSSNASMGYGPPGAKPLFSRR